MSRAYVARASGRVVCSAVAALLGALAIASPAVAEPSGIFGVFKQCPTGVPGVSLCTFDRITGGEFAIGSFEPIPENYTPSTGETITVSQPIAGLQAGTTYHYRLVADNPEGLRVVGPDKMFTTLRGASPAGGPEGGPPIPPPPKAGRALPVVLEADLDVLLLNSLLDLGERGQRAPVGLQQRR